MSDLLHKDQIIGAINIFISSILYIERKWKEWVSNCYNEKHFKRELPAYCAAWSFVLTTEIYRHQILRLLISTEICAVLTHHCKGQNVTEPFRDRRCCYSLGEGCILSSPTKFFSLFCHSPLTLGNACRTQLFSFVKQIVKELSSTSDTDCYTSWALTNWKILCYLQQYVIAFNSQSIAMSWGLLIYLDRWRNGYFRDWNMGPRFLRQCEAELLGTEVLIWLMTEFQWLIMYQTVFQWCAAKSSVSRDHKGVRLFLCSCYSL